MYVEPHARWYHQSAADFYNLYLIEPAPAPDFMSADPEWQPSLPRPSESSSGVATGRNGELSLRLRAVRAEATDQSSALPDCRASTSTRTLKATIVQLSWHNRVLA